MTTHGHQLRIYSAGAVAPPLQDAATLFEKAHGVTCRVTPGKPEAMLQSIQVTQAGDLFSAGAEYVLDTAEDRGVAIRGRRRSVGYRRSVIIVPPDNPANISSLIDLCRDHVRIGIATEGCLVGVWDDIASKAGLTDAIRRNITCHADACGRLMSLIHTRDVDAIFGWNAFTRVWPDTCDAIELPSPLQVYRSTAVGILACTADLALAQQFLDFLATPEVRSIYRGYGWIDPGTPGG